MQFYNASELSTMLSEKTETVVPYLFAAAKEQGNEFWLGSLAGESGKSLKIQRAGQFAGKWVDHATNERGDLIDLWQHAHSTDLQTAIKQIKDYLSISTTTLVTSKKDSKKWQAAELKGTPITIESEVFLYLQNERKLTYKTVQDYGLYVQQRWMMFPYFCNGILNSVKYLSLDRKDGKKDIRVSKDSKPGLFGWQAVNKNARQIVITEGELDAMTLYQYDLDYAVLSLPFGGGSNANLDKHKWIEHEYDRLSIFDTIYLCLDDDEVGDQALPELVKRLGFARCKIVKLPKKDANQCLIEGVTRQEIVDCFAAAKHLDPSELCAARELIESVHSEFYPSELKAEQGYDLPWSKYNNIKFKPAQLSVWTGTNGHGKSQLLGHVIVDCINQDAKVCIASLELKPSKLLHRLYRQAGGLRSPSAHFINAICDWLDEKLWIYNVVGASSIDRMLQVFEHAHRQHGVDMFVIDSLMMLGVSEEDLTATSKVVEKICQFKNDFNVHVHLVAHSRKSENEYIKRGKMDIKGTSNIANVADYCFSVLRNKKKEDEIAKADSETAEQMRGIRDCTLYCDKNRDGDWEGEIKLWFDKESLQYREDFSEKTGSYVAYEK